MNDAPDVGSILPDAQLLDSAGKTRSLSRAAGKGSLVLLVYQGASSPACVRQLLAYRDATMSFDRLGARIVGLSGDEPTTTAFLKSERGIAFPLFCDPDKTVLRQWGLIDPGTGEVRTAAF